MTVSLPTKVPFHPLTVERHSQGYLAVGIDGEFLQLDEDLEPIGEVRKPFPMSVRQTCLADGVFVGTWIDHELLMARMAAFDCTKPMLDGPEKGDLRTRTTIEAAQHPQGSIWSHVLDAEPLALCGHKEGFAFVLYKKGIYAMGNDAGEHWRVELPNWPELKKLPRANEVIAARFDRTLLKVWSRGGGTKSYDAKNGDLVSTGVFQYDGVLTNVYHEAGQELMVYDNGSIVWLCDDLKIAEGILAGPVQHARWDVEEAAWRMAGWREEIHLSESGFKRAKMDEIPVHVICMNNTTYILLNNGEWMVSNF
ncbi:hypothetical protein N9A87_00150 [Euryarchaeota archaeon]|nr:hypothetical protein [Euryarchaeota archaeon]